VVCLDTDFLIDLDRKDDKAVRKMQQLYGNNEFANTTIINAAEYFAGSYKSGRTDAIERAREYIRDFSVLTLDEESALLWGRLYSELRSSSIGDRDLFIASIALKNGETLVTRNVKHFERVPGLKVESW